MMRPLVRVVYEDRRGDQKAAFPLHTLVVRCVAELVSRPVHEVAASVASLTTNTGVGGALQFFADPSMRSRGEYLIAFLDRDRLPEHLSPPLPRSACRRQIFKGVLQQDTPSTGERELVLLEQNLESLLQHLEPSLPPSIRKQADIALRKGRGARAARDQVLTVVSQDRELREGLLAVRTSGHPHRWPDQSLSCLLDAQTGESIHFGTLRSRPRWPASMVILGVARPARAVIDSMSSAAVTKRASKPISFHRSRTVRHHPSPRSKRRV